MDRRPKKSRLSDINRNNVNLHKCITKISGAPDDYTLIRSDGKKISILIQYYQCYILKNIWGDPNCYIFDFVLIFDLIIYSIYN